MNHIKGTDTVLLIWNNCDQTALSNLANAIKGVAPDCFLVMEQSEQLSELSRPLSAFDIIISNWLPPYAVEHWDGLFHLILKFLKPSGKLVLKDKTDLRSTLIINGFVNITYDGEEVYYAEKPRFEIGSKLPLKINRQPVVEEVKSNHDVESAWKVANDDDETINDIDLLDEDDFKRPNQESLRVCATTGKRKACADCSCGLAEELQGKTRDAPKSSCGSCYLGDAFRCATCPYLGMPAFKPGEKVLLDLDSDI